MAAPRLLLLLPIFLSFAAIQCHGDKRAAGTFGDEVHSHGIASMMWTASSAAADDDARSPGALCAAVCGEADTRRRSEGGSREAPKECGVELEFSGLGWGESRLVGVDVDIGLDFFAAGSLRVYAFDDGIDVVDYSVFQQRQRHIGDGQPSLPVPHTVSMRLEDTRAAREAEGSAVKGHPPDSVTLRLEACGVSPGSVMGRGASVFLSEAGSDGGRDGDSSQDFLHLFGVLPTFSTGRGSAEEQVPAPPRLRSTAAAAGRPGALEDGESPAAASASVLLERAGTVGGEAGARGGGSRRRLQEDCSSSCLFSSLDPCVNDPECIDGGIGCNAQGDLLCRFCSTGDEEEDSVYALCRDPDDPTPAPVPTPAPTADPDRQECDAPCRDNPNAQDPCFDDPSCGGDTNLLGCNADGHFYCRYCDFEGALFDCPFSTATPAPTPAPSSAGTTAVPGTPAPSAVGTAAGSTSTPAAAATPAPSVVERDTNVTTLAPLTSTAAPTFAPVAVLSTAAPTAAPTTPVPATLAPAATFAPTSAPTAAPTPAPTPAALTAAPSGAPTAAAAAPTSAPTASPTAGVTAAPSAALSAAPTVVPTAMPTVAAGPLGPASVKGTISASGVPDELVAEKGEERLVQEAVCALNPCPEGPDSVTVTFGGSDSARMLLSAFQGRRRLADFEDVEFEVPTPAGAPTDVSGEPLTGSKQAAALFNKAADPKLSTIDEERGGLQVGKSEVQASRSMGPSPHSALVRSSSQENPDDGGSGSMAKSRSSSGRRPKTVPHTQSMGSEESSIVSDKFTYTNPMHKGEEIKKTGSPNEYGDDLAQHYEGNFERNPRSVAEKPVAGAIQAGAAAAAAAAQADPQPYGRGAGGGGGGSSSRWNTGSSVGEVKSALKTAGSFRNTEKPRSVSFADGSSSEYDSRVSRNNDEHDRGGMRALRQHLADPSQPSGSYRRQDSDEYSNESLSPSGRGSSMAGGSSFQSSFDTASTYSAASMASFATSVTSTNFSTGGGGGGGRGGGFGGGGGSRSAGMGGSQHSSTYSFRRVSSESSQSESDVDRPGSSIQRNPGGGGGGGGGGQRPLSWASTADSEEEVTARRRETSATAAAAAAAAYTPAELGATTTATATAAAEAEGKGDTAASAYRKMFAAGGRSNSGRSSSSGESKRRMVMR
eukprot:g7630.t1